ncbi:kinesin light chain [Niveomyces insectorum RCEF 264]|uniref:Kinesin light chain n=1 Tax=Niveomyces insectorum RCEF 264 TaxID=1081102 RepID=A0A167UXM6_9HYPO|nr:kinesin light chain [Niveomyces insectorum RCEF 264]
MAQAGRHYGVKTWHNPPGPTVDICFVHGLTGHRDKTWTVDGPRNEPWPPALLPTRFPHARLLSFGYDADVVRVRVASKDTIRSLADNLLYSLKDDRQEHNALHRPLVFVVHSLGGIVCKKAIARSQHSAEDTLASLAASLVGIVFMGTPHDGSSFASAAGLLVASVGWFKSTNKTLLRALKKDNAIAADTDNEFWEAWKVIERTSSAQIRIFCFFEILPLPAVKRRIVPEKSAVYQQHPSQKIDADHHNMVKFVSAEDPGFRRLCGVLRDFFSSKRADLLFAADLIQPFPSRPPAPLPRPRGSLSPPPLQPSSPAAAPPPLQRPPLHNFPHTPKNTTHVDIVSSREPQDESARASSFPPRETHSMIQRCYHLPFRQNRNFVGREDVLQQLRTLLFQEGHSIVALYGLGGVGKTQVANALAHWTKDHMTNHSVFWVPALSKPGFEEACTAIAAKLGIQRAKGQDVKALVRDHLSTVAAGKWLLVVDNADDPELVCGRGAADSLDHYFPQSDQGRILVTTRTRDVSQALASKKIQLDAFDIPQARRLASNLVEKPGLIADDAALVELVKELECLPLALTQAIVYMDQLNMPAREYLQLLRSTETDRVDLLGKEIPDSTRYKESRHAVTTTWLVSFNHLQATNPAAVDVLEFLSQIQPKAIPLSMLQIGGGGGGGGSDAVRLNAVSDLCAYGFVSKQDDVLDMHSLVHMATRSWIEKGGRMEIVARGSLDRMRYAFPSSDYANRKTWTAYLPHAMYMLRDGKAVDSVTGLRFCLRVCSCLYADGRIREALRMLENCNPWACESLAEQDRDRLSSEHELACAYLADGQVQRAVDLLEYVVGVKSSFAEDDSSRLTSQHELASAYHANGQIQKAVDLLEHVVRTQKNLPPDSYHRLASEHELARTYEANGQVQKAISMLEHVVDVKKRLAEDNPSRLASQHELALAYASDRRYTQAVELLEHVVSIRMRFARNHPNRLVAQHSLAVCLWSAGEKTRGIELMRYVVDQWKDLPPSPFSRNAKTFLERIEKSYSGTPTSYAAPAQGGRTRENQRTPDARLSRGDGTGPREE